jgi:hypothetical protein
MIIRASGDGLKDEEDDHAFQKLVGDVQRVRQDLTTTQSDVEGAVDDAAAAAADAAAASALAATKASPADITTALAPYALSSSIFTPTYVITTSSSGLTQNMTGGFDQLTTAIPNATGTGGMAISSGVFTAPATGLYHVTAAIHTFVNLGAGAASCTFEFSILNASFVGPRAANVIYRPAFSGGSDFGASLSANFSLSATDTLKFFAQVVPGAVVTPTTWVDYISVVRLL